MILQPYSTTILVIIGIELWSVEHEKIETTMLDPSTYSIEKLSSIIRFELVTISSVHVKDGKKCPLDTFHFRRRRKISAHFNYIRHLSTELLNSKENWFTIKEICSRLIQKNITAYYNIIKMSSFWRWRTVAVAIVALLLWWMRT